MNNSDVSNGGKIGYNVLYYVSVPSFPKYKSLFSYLTVLLPVRENYTLFDGLLNVGKLASSAKTFLSMLISSFGFWIETRYSHLHICRDKNSF